MSRRPHVVVIGGNDPALLDAAALDVDITLFQLPERVTDTQISTCARTLLFDCTQSEAVVQLGRAVHATYPVTCVVSFWEKSLLPAAELVEAIGAVGNPVAPVLASRDKLRFRELTARLSSAAHSAISDPSDAISFFEQASGPIVIKPSTGSGSLGVSFVSDRQMAADAFRYAAQSECGPVLAEEYVDGDELSVETLTLSGDHNVIGVTRKTTTGPPHFIEIGHEFPADVDEFQYEALASITTNILDLIGHQYGPAHTEFRLGPAGPFPIETHTRFGGDQIWELVKLTTGVSLAGQTISHLAGVEASMESGVASAAAIGFFALESCRVEKVEGLNCASRIPGVLRVSCDLQPGRQLGPLRCSANRQGYVLAVADRPALARERVSEAFAQVRIAVS